MNNEKKGLKYPKEEKGELEKGLNSIGIFPYKNPKKNMYDLGMIETNKDGVLFKYTPSQFVLNNALAYSIYNLFGIFLEKDSNKDKIQKLIIQPDKNLILYNNNYDENFNKLCPICSGMLITKENLYKCHECGVMFKEYLIKEELEKIKNLDELLEKTEKKEIPYIIIKELSFLPVIDKKFSEPNCKDCKFNNYKNDDVLGTCVLCKDYSLFESKEELALKVKEVLKELKEIDLEDEKLIFDDLLPKPYKEIVRLKREKLLEPKETFIPEREDLSRFKNIEYHYKWCAFLENFCKEGLGLQEQCKKECRDELVELIKKDSENKK